jgi:uncharacterized protein
MTMPPDSIDPLVLNKLTDDDWHDFDAFENILDDLRTRETQTPQWEFCEGFMVALICCRRSIEPAEYLPVLLATDPDEAGSPALFADGAQFDRFMELWTRRWHKVSTALDAEIETLYDAHAYHPAVLDLHDEMDALTPGQRADLGNVQIPAIGEVWAIGFMYAVENWPEEWAAPHDGEAARALNDALEYIVTLAEGDTGLLRMPHPKESLVPPSLQRLLNFADALWAAYSLRALWRSIGARPACVQRLATPGRNDPCSCGSGKKYKKCCGANSSN